MKKIIQYAAVFLIALTFSNCEDNIDTSDLNYVAFEATNYSFGVDLDSETTKSIKLYATKSSGSDRTFNVSVLEGTTADAASYTVPSSITIPSGQTEGSFDVTIKDMNIGQEGKKLMLRLDPSEGTYLGETMEIDIFQVCPLNEVVLKITLDGYPEEIYWRLVDGSGNVVDASATPAAYGAYEGMEGDVSKKFCLEDGSYVFEIYDAYGDGAGPVLLSSNGTTIFETDGAYEGGTGASFSLPL